MHFVDAYGSKWLQTIHYISLAAKELNNPIHISHVSCYNGFSVFESYKKEAKPISIWELMHT